MGRKTKKGDFDLTKPSMGGGEPHFSGLWGVFEGYEITKLEDVPPYIQARGAEARSVEDISEIKKTYRPLADTPYLFLDFARLADKPLSEETVYDWVEEYGVLGLHYGGSILPNLEMYYGTVSPPLMYDWEGGRSETVESFIFEAKQAGSILSLYEAVYEAVLNKDDEKLLRWVLQGATSTKEVAKGVENLWGSQPLVVVGTEDAEIQLPAHPYVTLTEMAVDKALKHVWGVVEDKLSNFAYPAINHESPNTSAIPGFHRGGLFAPDRLAASWGFRNLLGAMWLQFYWLITSRADLKRCKYCGRIISLTAPIPQGGEKKRKRRSDTKYCNKQCQQNYDYHKRKKPKRESEDS